MKTLIALAGSLLVVGSASAAFDNVYAEQMDSAEGEQTWRFYAAFTSPDDFIGAYAGLEGQPLYFTSYVGGIINHDGTYGMGHVQDLPFGNLPGDADTDTWLTIGQVGGFVGFPSFSPFFLGSAYEDPANPIQVLVDGMESFSDEDSAVFIAGPAAPVTTWGDYTNIPLAQFTVPYTEGGMVMEFGGVLQWAGPDGDPVQTYFEVVVPTPGALALLGLAGLIGRRRR
jgi:hypothetical protein